ncbi:MAK10-like protein [Tanacetum coccineum]
MNTIESPVWNNVVPLRSDTIRERTRLRLFQFSFRDQASNWLERLPAGSITTWEDLTTHFLAQFFPPGRTTKLRNDILMFQQHQGESLSEAWTHFKDLLQKLRDKNAKESWALLEDLALYDNESWNDPRDFAKPVKAISLPQDVPMKKITPSYEICSGPNDTQYCMEDPEQAFVEYASLRTDEAEGLVSNFMASQDARLSKFEADFKQKQSEMTNKIDTVLKAITDRIAGTLPSNTVKNLKLSTYPVLSAHSYPTEDPQCSTQTHVPSSSNTELICTKKEDGDVMFVEIIPKDDNSREEEPEAKGQEVEYFDIFLTRSELAYHKYLIYGPIPSIFLRSPIIMEGCPSNLKIPCNIGHVNIEKAYIDLNSPLNVITRMMYNWIMRRKLNPQENVNGGVSNFTGRIKRMHVFVGNFTYIVDFVIIEDISSIIDPRLSQVVLGKPFVEISNMTHDPPEGVVRFTNGNNEVAYKMPHKIEQYDSLSNLEKEHTKLVYLRNKEDKRRGVEYVMSKILGFYKDCLELRPEYLTGMDDEGEVT